MSDIQYSTDALNVLSDFYGVDTLVYVEGEDDVIFWQAIFEKFATRSVRFESVGGDAALAKRIAQICAGEVHALAAADADYSALVGSQKHHPCILYSFGYSIENSLFTVESLTEICNVVCRGFRASPDICRNWLASFLAAFRELIAYDIANRCTNGPELVLGDNCSRFMVDGTAHQFCGKKIAAKCKALETVVDPDQIEHWRLETSRTDFDLLRWIRGHFLTTAIQKFIVSRLKEIGKKPVLSGGQVFESAMIWFRMSVAITHPHSEHYRTAVMRADGDLRAR